MIGIYKITNLKNQLCYIGQSVNITRRWQDHKKNAFNEKDHSYNTPLYRAIRKYGLESFLFEVIEECSTPELNEKERYWISFYDSFFNGYNLTFGGDSAGREISKEKIIQIIKDLEDTDLIQKEIAIKNNISEEMVQGINTGRYWHHDREYPIRPGRDHIDFFCVDCGKKISKNATRCLECERKHRIIPLSEMPVTREELKSLIRNKSFVQIGKQFGVSDNSVRKWCDKFNLPRRALEIKKYSEEEWFKI